MPTELNRKKIRARVTSPFGVVETPYILSFNVTKTRNQKDSFSCSLKIKNDSSGEVTDVGEKITIEAGVDSPEHVVFCGYVTSIKIRPSFEDPSYHIVDLSGTDVRKFIEDKKITRRQTREDKSWAEVTGVNRRDLRSSKLKYTRRSEFASSAFPAPADQESSEASTKSSSVLDLMKSVSTTRSAGTGNRGNVEFYAFHINDESES